MELSIFDIVKAGDCLALNNLIKTCSLIVLDQRDKFGRTPLIHACLSTKYDILTILLKKGANCALRDQWGKTVLMYATGKGDLKMINQLLNAGADVNSIDNFGKNVLSYAINCRNYTEITQLFSEASEKRTKSLESLKIKSHRKNHHEKVTQDNQSPTTYDPFNETSPSPEAPLSPSSFSLIRNAFDYVRRGDLKDLQSGLQGGFNVNGLNQRDHLGRTPLMCAIARGYPEIISELLEAGSDITCRDYSGKTVLIYAISKGDHETIQKLLKHNVDINASDGGGRTPLMRACLDGEMRMITDLIQAKAKIDAVDNWGRTALHYTASSGNLSAIKLLVDAGANIRLLDYSGKGVLDHAKNCNNFLEVSQYIQEELSKQTTTTRETIIPEIESPKKSNNTSPRSPARPASPFNPKAGNKIAFDLAKRGDTEAIKPIVGGAFSSTALNETDSRGRTPLMLACIYGKFEVMEELLTAGVDVSARDDIGKTVLFYAVAEGDLKAIQKLIDAGCNIRDIDSNGRTPLMQACIFGNIQAIKVLLEAGAKPTNRDLWGKTSLMYATAKGDLETMKLLINAGADLDSIDYSGKSVQDYGLSCRNFSAVKQLLNEERGKQRKDRRKSSVTQNLPRSLSPLPKKNLLKISVIDMARRGDAKTVKKILEQEATMTTLDERDCNGRTPLMLSCLHSNHEIMSELVKAGADACCRDLWGKTALMYAAAKGDAIAMRILIDHGADVFTIDNVGKTVMDYATAQRNYQEVMNLIEEAKEKRRAISLKYKSKHHEEDRFDSPQPTRPSSPISPFSLEKNALTMAKIGDSEGIKLLVCGGLSKAALNFCDNNGRTALVLACIYGYKDSMRYLLEAGADVSYPDEWGRTSLMYASSKGDVELVQLLLNYNADVNQKDLSNKDSIDYARTSRHLQEILPLLLDAKKNKKSEKLKKISPKKSKSHSKLMRASTSPSLTSFHNPIIVEDTTSPSLPQTTRDNHVDYYQSNQEKNYSLTIDVD